MLVPAAIGSHPGHDSRRGGSPLTPLGAQDNDDFEENSGGTTTAEPTTERDEPRDVLGTLTPGTFAP